MLVLLWLMASQNERALSFSLVQLGGPRPMGHLHCTGRMVGTQWMMLSFVAVLSLGTHIPVGRKAKLCQALSSAPSIPGPSNSKA